MPVFVLVHSPLVGPATWSPVAAELDRLGCAAIVPSLLDVGRGGPPYWPRVVGAVIAALSGTDPGPPMVLVAHSGAGVFVPVLVRGLGRPVTCSIFADATVPAASGHTPVVGEQFLSFLRGLADPAGLLPPWTDWWEEDEVAALFPSGQAREAVTREQPRLPVAYYQEQVPAPTGWAGHPCAYLRFSPAYADQADQARRRGWPVRSLPGEHLHQIVAPRAVARTLVDLAEACGGRA